MRKAILICGLVLSVCFHAAAQKNQVAVVLGAKVTPSVGNVNSINGVTTVNNSFALEGNFAHQIAGVKVASLQVEFPFIFARQAGVNTFNLFAAQSYSSFFFTPSLKLQVLPKAPLSPWISAGAGLARFSPNGINLVGGLTAANTTTKAAYQGGAGLDFKLPVLPLTFRVEARELYTGTPNLGVAGLNLRNNIIVGGGIVLNF